MIGWSKIDVRNDQWERLRGLLHTPHEHCEGRNECPICDKPLIEDAADKIESLQASLDEANILSKGAHDAWHLWMEQAEKDRIRAVKAEASNKVLRETVVTAYECGHNDTVESNYCDPQERANEIIEEALAHNEDKS